MGAWEQRSLEMADQIEEMLLIGKKRKENKEKRERKKGKEEEGKKRKDKHIMP